MNMNCMEEEKSIQIPVNTVLSDAKVKTAIVYRPFFLKVILFYLYLLYVNIAFLFLLSHSLTILGDTQMC